MPKPIRTLLLEKEAADADRIWEELGRAGLEPIPRCVATKEDFSAALASFEPELILAGCDTFGANALESLAVARAICPAPVIMIAGSPNEDLAIDAIRRGAFDCVFKDRLFRLGPVSQRALREAEERKERRRAEVLSELRYQQLQLQNEALVQSEERFRQLAESVREVFWMTDLEKGQMLYVSPGYEAIWGRTCASLYASPMDWLEAIHPEDRQRIAQAAMSKQASGDYDEEYRVVRPDGSMRWIHDRAFPVRDESGAAYRIAGVAEDITDRKHLEKQVLEISDREQARIGRDLHDGLCQLLVSIGFNVHALQQDLEAQTRSEAGSAERIGRKISDALKMARNLAQGLYPVNLQSESLAIALDKLAQNTSEDYRVACAAECAEANSVADPAAATHVYRIAQEAVHNAVKHGNPSRVLIRLASEAGRIVLTVRDNGCGFSPNPHRGMGLEIMKYRANLLCASLEIRPINGAEGSGTILTCSFPQNSI